MMKLDRTFVREIIKANGDGSREAKFAFLNPAKEAAKALSTPDIRYTFGDVLRTYDRATVGICVAATVLERWDRLNPSTVQWAHEVMRLWTNRPSTNSSVLIRDDLHPTRIEEYAGSFIRLTTEEA